MKKLLPLFLILFIAACEDEKDESANLNGTYKLNKADWDCDGDEDIQYLTVENSEGNARLTFWDYMGDECDDMEDCYEKESITLTKKGDNYSWGGSEISLTKTSTGMTISGTEGTDGWTEVWDTESSDIKTYSPVCD